VSENIYPSSSAQEISHNKAFILLGFTLVLCLLAAGLNLHYQSIWSSNLIGIEIEIKKDRLFIFNLLDNGPALKAGVQQNSYIVSINNVSIRNFQQLNEILLESETEITLELSKDKINSSYILQKGMPPDFSDIFITTLICTLFLLLAFISIPSKGNRNSTRNLLLILLFLFLGLEYILLPLRSFQYITTGVSQWAVISGIILTGIVGGLTFALELHILCITPKPHPWFIKHKKTILTSFYSVSCFFIIVLNNTYLDYYTEGLAGSLFSYMTWSMINIIWVSLILTILFIQFFSTKSSRGKNQLIILFIAILPFVISIAFLEWNFLTESPDQNWLPTFEIFSHFSFLIGFLISIKRYDLADIGQDIQRPFVFMVVSALIIFYLLNNLYEYFLNTEFTDQSNFLYFGMSSLVIGMLWLPLSRLLQNWASNPWNHDSEYSNPILHNILDGVMAYSHNHRVAENLPRLLNSSLHSNWSAVLLTENNEKPYFQFKQQTGLQLPKDQLEAEMINLFYEQKSYTQNSPQSTESKTLFELGATHAFPLIYHDEFLGNLVLSQAPEHDYITNKSLNIFSKQLAEIIYSNKMRTLATTDGLTRLFRREAIIEKLHSEFIRYQRTGEEISICLIDIDHFKQVNDTYGHAAGDIVLQQIAKSLNERIRITDSAGRYGGEEFLLIFPKTNITEVKDLLESLRQSIQITPVKINSNTLIKTSVSIGIASTENLHPLTDKKPYNLVQNFISEADIALYRAKETGRNKVVIAANIQ
jgi:diguanylate cyclase (GGDEF)-like protein